MFLLDTNVVSVSRRPDLAPAGLARWVEETPVEEMFVSSLTILEIERGLIRLSRRDPRQSAGLRRWLEGTVLVRFVERILPFDTATARRCAALHVPDPRPEIDAMIAATALEHGLTVVTRNAADFEPMGVRVLNPWTP